MISIPRSASGFSPSGRPSMTASCVPSRPASGTSSFRWRTGALRVYKTLWNILDEEYGMEPSVKTQQLIADIKNGQFESEVLSIAGDPMRRDGTPALAFYEAPSRSPALSRTAAKIAILVD